MSVIDKLLKLYNVLDVDEKKDFLLVVSRKAKEDGVVTGDELKKYEAVSKAHLSRVAFPSIHQGVAQSHPIG